MEMWLPDHFTNAQIFGYAISSFQMPCPWWLVQKKVTVTRAGSHNQVLSLLLWIGCWLSDLVFGRTCLSSQNCTSLCCLFSCTIIRQLQIHKGKVSSDFREDKFHLVAQPVVRSSLYDLIVSLLQPLLFSLSLNQCLSLLCLLLKLSGFCTSFDLTLFHSVNYFNSSPKLQSVYSLIIEIKVLIQQS